MGGGASARLKKAAKKMFVRYFCHGNHTHNHNSAATLSPVCSPNYSLRKKISSQIAGQPYSSASPCCNKNLCPICLDPLNYSSGGSPGQAIFTAQCSHAFHLACIASNVRHGSVTCPICRAHWTQLPRNLNLTCSLHPPDPVLQILDNSIANSRVHRRSFLRSARYDDDDPIDPDHAADLHPRLHLSLLTLPLPRVVSSASSSPHFSGSPTPSNRTCLRVKLAHQPATDLVLVASPNGPHLRLMKQAMALVVFSLHPTDRLAIVTYSSAAARVFPLRRMTSYGKKAALQVIDRLFYMGQADPMEGLSKGVKILGDRVHKNPQSRILHLTDNPSRSYHHFDVPVALHRFHVGYGFTGGFIMHEFEEFLARTLGGAIRDVQLRVDDSARVIRIGELRGGEERNIPVYLDDFGLAPLCVEYSYVDSSGDEECVRSGEIVVGMDDKGDRMDIAMVGARMSSAENWDYHDPFMARRWAKHLHAYRL